MQYLVHHMLQNSASRGADREALVDGDQRLDYATMAQRVAALAHGLRALGVRDGSRELGLSGDSGRNERKQSNRSVCAQHASKKAGQPP